MNANISNTNKEYIFKEKIVYIEKPVEIQVEKIIYKEKIIEVPVEKIIYRDRYIEIPSETVVYYIAPGADYPINKIYNDFLKEIECIICCEIFETTVRPPVLYENCTHSVCLNCFEKSLLKCPICNRENLNFNSKKNYCLMNLIDNFSRKLIHNYADNLTNEKNKNKNKNKEVCNLNKNTNKNILKNIDKHDQTKSLISFPKKNNLATFLQKASEIEYSSSNKENECEIENYEDIKEGEEEKNENTSFENAEKNVFSQEARNLQEYININISNIQNEINHFNNHDIDNSSSNLNSSNNSKNKNLIEEQDEIEEDENFDDEYLYLNSSSLEEKNNFYKNKNEKEENSNENKSSRKSLDSSRNSVREADFYFQSEFKQSENGHCVALYGHKANVLCVLALGESQIASGAEDKVIKIWDIKRFICLKTLRGHTDKVLAIAKINFNNYNNNDCDYDKNKSNLICSCSADSKIKFWDLQTGACVKTLRSHENWVISMLCFSEEIFLSGDAEGKLIFWDLIKFKKIRKINAHANHWINSMCKLSAFSFATCSGDFTIKLWDIANFECFRVLKHESIVWGIVSLNEKFINCLNDNTNNDNKNINFKNSDDYNDLIINNNKNNNYNNNINNKIEFSQNQEEIEIQFIISCSSDGRLKKWNLQDFTCENFEGDLNILKSISLLDSNKLLSLGWDGHIKLWDPAEKRLLKNFSGNVLKSDSFVNGICVIKENTIATCDEDKCVKIWFNVS